MSFDTIPKDLRGLRACLVCSLIKVSSEDLIAKLVLLNEIFYFSRRSNSSSLMAAIIVTRF